MHTLHESRAQRGARELITTSGTTFAARIAEIDAMQLRFELLTNRRPAPLRGTLQLGRRNGSWLMLAGTLLDVHELARQHGDDPRELEAEIRRVALEHANRVSAPSKAVVW